MKRSHAVTYLLFATLAGVWIVQAGSLEPTGPPAPTMKPLSHINSSWAEQILPVLRFELVMNGEGVLDHETGLVWQHEPDQYHPAGVPWSDAVSNCYGVTTGDRKGWRLPTIEELASLVDPNYSDPPLPTGHPFGYIPRNTEDEYWSITNSAWPGTENSRAYTMSMMTGFVSQFPDKTGDSAQQWCVRGGIGHNPDSAP